jgi:hypothetical protein
VLTLTPYILPLIGLIFLILCLVFLVRARSARISSVTARTRRKPGWVYLCVGAVLTLLGISRL